MVPTRKRKIDAKVNLSYSEDVCAAKAPLWGGIGCLCEITVRNTVKSVIDRKKTRADKRKTLAVPSLLLPSQRNTNSSVQFSHGQSTNSFRRTAKCTQPLVALSGLLRPARKQTAPPGQTEIPMRAIPQRRRQQQEQPATKLVPKKKREKSAGNWKPRDVYYAWPSSPGKTLAASIINEKERNPANAATPTVIATK